MVDIFFPEASKVQGTKKITFCTTLASPAAPKIATELKAGTSVEATMAIRSFDPVNTTNTGNSPARLGTTTQLPQEGNTNLGAIPIAGVFDPSVDDDDDNNALKALLVEGWEGYAVVRRGTDIQTDWTVADVVDVFYGRIGYVDDDSKSGDDEFAEYEFHTNFYQRLPKVKGVLAT